MAELKNISNCKNCNKELPLNADFCPNCGQTTKNKKIGIKDLFYDLFNNFLIFDFKIFRSFFAILHPGKLTKEFFSGRHGRFTSPWRFFFIAIVLMLIIININNRFSEEDSSFFKFQSPNVSKKNKSFYFDFSDGLEIEYSDKSDKKNTPLKNKVDSLNHKFHNITEESEIDSLIKDMSKDSILSEFKIDSISKSWFKKFKKKSFQINSLKKHLTKKDYNNVINVFTAFDTTYYSGDSLVRKAIDSTAFTLKNQLKDMFIDSMYLFNKNVSLYDKNTLSKKELIEKYNIKKKDFFNKLKEDIYYKFNADKVSFDDLIKFALNNLNWFIIFLMPFAAFIFKLLYVRRKRFFVEHLVFNLHSHTAILLLFSLAIILGWLNYEIIDDFLIFFTILGPSVYYILAMKKYYSQSWLKTIFKFLLFSFIYFILLIIATIIFGVIAAVFV